MKDKIMIIGGAGHVGRIIARQLVHEFPHQLILAGRNQAKLTEFITSEHLAATALTFDINAEFDPALFADVRLVVVCLDQANTKFVRFCQEQHLAYVDVSANAMFYRQLQQLELNTISPVVYSVGLAPGLTNLMAAHVHQELGNFDDLAIKVVLGLGDSHGHAAIDWTLTELTRPYQLAGESAPLIPFSQQTKMTLPTAKELPVYNFNFSDQHSLRQQWPGKAIKTYLGFDLSSVTRAVALSQKLKLLAVLKNKRVKQVAASIMSKGIIGSAHYWVQVTAKNKQTHQSQTLTVTGEKEARVTGELAALLIKNVYHSTNKTGLLSMADFCTYPEVLRSIPSLTELPN